MFKVPDGKASESRTLAKKEGIKAGSWKGKRDSTVKGGSFREGEGGQARKSLSGGKQIEA